MKETKGQKLTMQQVYGYLASKGVPRTMVHAIRYSLIQDAVVEGTEMKYDRIYVYAWMMAKYLAEEGSVEGALSRYYTGTPGAYCDTYVRDVLRWSNTIQEEEENG